MTTLAELTAALHAELERTREIKDQWRQKAAALHAELERTREIKEQWRQKAMDRRTEIYAIQAHLQSHCHECAYWVGMPDWQQGEPDRSHDCLTVICERIEAELGLSAAAYDYSTQARNYSTLTRNHK